MTNIKKFIFVSFICLSQIIVFEPTLNEVIASQNLSEKLSQPICPEHKLSGSLEEATVLGMLLTLGATTAELNALFMLAMKVNIQATHLLLCRDKIKK